MYNFQFSVKQESVALNFQLVLQYLTITENYCNQNSELKSVPRVFLL